MKKSKKSSYVAFAVALTFTSTLLFAHPSGHRDVMQYLKNSANEKKASDAMKMPENGDFVRLVAGLDEPEEFYCFDLAGWGKKLKIDDPLQAHTCKKTSGADQMFSFNDGRLEVEGHDRCVEVAGSDGLTLPGAAVLARPCGDGKLQMLSLQDNGTIRVTNTDLCIAAGAKSEPASGPSHMWRTLTVVDCNADQSLLRWQVGL